MSTHDAVPDSPAPSGPDAGPPPPPSPPPVARNRATPGARAGRLGALAADLVRVVADGGRLWLRHWPVLLTIALLGGAARMGAIWAATAVSDTNGTLGFAVLVLGPLGSVAAIVLMLLTMRGSLPALAAATAASAPLDPTTRRERRVIDVLASVLVPFLAVYASYGYLAEDRERFENATVLAERSRDIWSDTAVRNNFDRALVASGWVVVALVVLAVVLRWGLARLEGRVHATPLGFAGAYVEAFWLIVLAAGFASYREEAWAWVESRRAIDIVIGWWESFLDLLGPIAGPVDAVADQVLQILTDLDDLVVVPLAWLAVGAVVFGRKLEARPLKLKVPRRLERVPGPVRLWVGKALKPVGGDLRARFSALVNGTRQLAVAGLGPMLVFGLAFLVALRLEDLLVLGVRALAGPQPVRTWTAFSPHVETVTRAVGLTVTAALLAAAVNRVLAATPVEEPADGPEEPADEPVAAPAADAQSTDSSR